MSDKEVVYDEVEEEEEDTVAVDQQFDDPDIKTGALFDKPEKKKEDK